MTPEAGKQYRFAAGIGRVVVATREGLQEAKANKSVTSITKLTFIVVLLVSMLYGLNK